MPIELTLHRVVRLSDLWCDKGEFNEAFKDDRKAMMELLKEDWATVIEECGGLEGIVESYRWVD